MNLVIFPYEIWTWKLSQNGPRISDAANFRKLYLRAQKELDGKSGIYDYLLDQNFHVNKFLERSGTFFVPKTKLLEKVSFPENIGTCSFRQLLRPNQKYLRDKM